MKHYRAKTIQEILQIPKFRYDYLMMKIRIDPDIEKVSGTGRTNLFSFAKLLEFGIASSAIDIGMNPEVIRSSLVQIRDDDNREGWQLFNPDSEIKQVSFHYAINRGIAFYTYSGIRRNKSAAYTIELPTGGSADAQFAHRVAMVDKATAIGLEKAFGYLTLNLSEIKQFIISKL
ncbi:MAG: hypothetical protein V1844_16285 [Pseudomonadota bacterium]